jgi:hypothetical protein
LFFLFSGLNLQNLGSLLATRGFFFCSLQQIFFLVPTKSDLGKKNSDFACIKTSGHHKTHQNSDLACIKTSGHHKTHQNSDLACIKISGHHRTHQNSDLAYIKTSGHHKTHQNSDLAIGFGLQHHKNSDFCLQQNSFGHYYLQTWIGFFCLQQFSTQIGYPAFAFFFKNPHIVKLLIFKSTILLNNFLFYMGT